MYNIKDLKLCVVGLGYVGLPLLVLYGKKYNVCGFDISKPKVETLKKNIDPTGELSTEEMKKAKIEFSSDPSIIKKCNFIIVAVPTPVTEAKTPDITPVESASKIVGENLQKGAIVVFESTVYPGLTEEICVPILEKCSGLKCGVDFKIGYSPERTNPGDKEHTVDKIKKIVSGMDKESADYIAEVYGSIITAGIFKAKDIKTAEAAKVIENIQRDLNIALANELSLIFSRIGISTKDVIEAAATKWNFQKYTPGLVGGHCIGVDPYYLTFKAQSLGYDPQVILAGRRINEYMAKHVAELTVKALSNAGKTLRNSTVLLLGLTFKENVSDCRNSKAEDVIKELKQYNVKVIACDPKLDKQTVKKVFDVDNYAISELKNDLDCVIMISPHKELKEAMTLAKLKQLMPTNMPILIDVKSAYNAEEAKANGFIYKAL